MANITTIQKNKLLRKLRNINVLNEKDILNLKVYELKKIKDNDKLTLNDIEIIWLMQEAIEKKSLLDFFTDQS
ncbi:MAG: hypothetical protein E7310_07200 [Clostridiales bacterium]|nr:hypothetical protein [Clostridiales bacterium]